MNHRRIVFATLFGAVAAVSSASALAQIEVNIAPPPPRHENVPGPRAGYEWAPGYWNWNGHRYVWVSGHYVHARNGYRWAAPEWVEHNGRWQFQSGRWNRGDNDRHDNDRHDNDRRDNDRHDNDQHNNDRHDNDNRRGDRG
jgi:WXXGXW repeat (2 copies)